MYSVRSILAALALLLGGCVAAPQQPVPLAPQIAGSGSPRLGIAMTALPKVNTFFPGANCLLCIAAAEIANQSLTAHTQTLPYEDLPTLKEQAAAALATKGLQTKVIGEPINVAALPDNKTKGPNIARKDFSSLQTKYQIDKLLVIDITMLGMIRPYASYFPGSDPKAVIDGTGYIVNLSNNTFEWYAPLNVTRSADGTWDEAPSFPGLTNAYFQVIEKGKDNVLKPLNAATTAQALPSAAPTVAEQTQ